MTDLIDPWQAASDPFDYPAAMERQEKKIAYLEAQRVRENMLCFKWMERHDKLLGFLQKSHPELLAELPDWPFPRPATPMRLIQKRGADELPRRNPISRG